jgi:hypothetical protein
MQSWWLETVRRGRRAVFFGVSREGALADKMLNLARECAIGGFSRKAQG